jgi:phosphoserine phosphatase
VRFALGRAGNAEMKHHFLSAALGGLHRTRVARLAGCFAATRAERMIKLAARKRIAAHLAAGDVLVLATGSPDIYAEVVVKRLGFHHVVATRSRWQAEHIVPGLEGANLRGDAKRAAAAGSDIQIEL